MNSWIIDPQVFLSMGFSRQEYWSGLPFPSPGELSRPGIESISCTAGGFFTTRPPGRADCVLQVSFAGSLSYTGSFLLV